LTRHRQKDTKHIHNFIVSYREKIHIPLPDTNVLRERQPDTCLSWRLLCLSCVCFVVVVVFVIIDIYVVIVVVMLFYCCCIVVCHCHEFEISIVTVAVSVIVVVVVRYMHLSCCCYWIGSIYLHFILLEMCLQLFLIRLI